MTRTTLVLASLLMVVGCGTEGGTSGPSGGPTLGGKADLARDLEVRGQLNPGDEVASALLADDTRHGYIIYASASSIVDLEITQRGSSRGIDTSLALHGPRLADGTYNEEIVRDDEAGYGQLSHLAGVSVPYDGFYMVEVTSDAAAEFVAGDYNLAFLCDEGCWAPGPVAEIPDAVHWVRNSAEYHTAVSQAYALATLRLELLAASGDLSGPFTVALDADETVLSNSLYQYERAELGLGYSATAWAEWVQRREATALPGARAFLTRVHELGGSVAIVTNRADALCEDTAANLTSEGLEFDEVLCRTGSSNKQARWDDVANGRGTIPAGPIVMWVGDNIRDFPDGDQAIRFADESTLGDFGDRYVVIPNPMYGSWTGNERR